MKPPPFIPTGSGPLAEFARWTQEAIRALQPISAPGMLTGSGPRGVVQKPARGAAANSQTGIKSLVVRHIGIDAMWVSRPLFGSMVNYWYDGDEDLSEHFFCLKPFQLQNRWWWDEVNEESLGSNEFWFAPGTSPQSSLTTVQSVVGVYYDYVGPFTGLTARTLHVEGLSPEPAYWEYISPPFYAPDDGIFTTGYSGNTTIVGQRIPKGLLVCDETGKIVWDAWDTFSNGAKPETETRVTTWGIGEAGSPSGLWSPVKAGLYDVEFIDINVDGRHWKQVELSQHQLVNSFTGLNSSQLDPTKIYNLQVSGGTMVWTEVP